MQFVFSESKPNFLECIPGDPINTFDPSECCPLLCNPKLFAATSAPGCEELTLLDEPCHVLGNQPSPGLQPWLQAQAIMQVILHTSLLFWASSLTTS